MSVLAAHHVPPKYVRGLRLVSEYPLRGLIFLHFHHRRTGAKVRAGVVRAVHSRRRVYINQDIYFDNAPDPAPSPLLVFGKVLLRKVWISSSAATPLLCPCSVGFRCEWNE